MLTDTLLRRKCCSYIAASKVGAATLSLGQFLAPHIRRSGSKILSQTTGMNENRATQKINSVLNVTAGAVEGIGTIYNGLESSAVIFGRSLSNNTVQIVKHKYLFSTFKGQV